MAGKTISAYTDAETASHVAQLAKLQHRPQAQIAGLALKFFVRLPKEAHDALRQIEAQGSPADLEAISREITRVLLHTQYEVAQRQIIDQMKVEKLDQLESEDDILNVAVDLTR